MQNWMKFLQIALQLLVAVAAVLAGRNYGIQDGADPVYVGIPGLIAVIGIIASIVLGWIGGKPPTMGDFDQIIKLLAELMAAKGVDPAVKMEAVEVFVQAGLAKPAAARGLPTMRPMTRTAP